MIEFIERYEKRGECEAILKAKSMIDPSAEIIERPMIQTSNLSRIKNYFQGLQ